MVYDTARGRFTLAQLESRWQTGQCGTYARALQLLRPALRIGVLGVRDCDGFQAAHFIAHDDIWAYDSLGRHTLPYLGVNNQFDMVFLNQFADWWGCIEEEHASEDDARRALAAAMRHARRYRVIG